MSTWTKINEDTWEQSGLEPACVTGYQRERTFRYNAQATLALQAMLGLSLYRAYTAAGMHVYDEGEAAHGGEVVLEFVQTGPDNAALHHTVLATNLTLRKMPR